jgi:hypothetical protein
MTSTAAAEDDFKGLSRGLRAVLQRIGPKEAEKLRSLLRAFSAAMNSLGGDAVLEVEFDGPAVRAVRFVDLAFGLEPNGRRTVVLARPFPATDGPPKIGPWKRTPISGLMKGFEQRLWDVVRYRTAMVLKASGGLRAWRQCWGENDLRPTWSENRSEITRLLEIWAARGCAFGGRPIWPLARIAAAQVTKLMKSSPTWPIARACSLGGGKSLTITSFNSIGGCLSGYSQAYLDSKRLIKLVPLSRALDAEGARRLFAGPKRGVIGRLKALWRELGLSELGWKYLHRLDAGSMNSLLARLEREGLAGRLATPRDWAFVLSVVAQATRKGVRGLFRAITPLLVGDRYAKRLGAHPLDRRFAQVAVRKALELCKGLPGNSRREAGEMFAREIVDIRDWLEHGADDERAALQATSGTPGFGWAWFKDHAHGWATRMRHLEDDDDERAPRRDASWPVPFSELEVDGFLVRCLGTQLALDEEAARMHHCVDSYGGDCEEGRSLIMSIGLREVSLATVELRPGGPGWQIRQVRGPCNAAIDDERLLEALRKALTIIRSWTPQAISSSAGHEPARRPQAAAQAAAAA